MSVEIKQITRVSCGGPGCNFTLEWNDADLQKNPDLVPDAAYRLLVFQPFVGGREVFCSTFCLVEYLKSYQPLKSPREQRLELEAQQSATSPETAARVNDIVDTASASVVATGSTEQDSNTLVATPKRRRRSRMQPIAVGA